MKMKHKCIEKTIYAPIGMRVATETERVKNRYPSDCLVLFENTTKDDGIKESLGNIGWNDVDNLVFFVPKDYKFQQKKPFQNREARELLNRIRKAIAIESIRLEKLEMLLEKECEANEMAS